MSTTQTTRKSTAKVTVRPVDDTPTTEHDCATQEMEAVRYEHGIDIPDSRYL